MPTPFLWLYYTPNLTAGQWGEEITLLGMLTNFSRYIDDKIFLVYIKIHMEGVADADQ